MRNGYLHLGFEDHFVLTMDLRPRIQEKARLTQKESHTYSEHRWCVCLGKTLNWIDMYEDRFHFNWRFWAISWNYYYWFKCREVEEFESWCST